MFQISITSRSIEIQKGINDYVTKQLNQAAKHFKDVLDIDVILSKQRGQYLTEITLYGEGFTLHAKGMHSKDVYLSIDEALNRIKSQLDRYKKKIVSRKRKQRTLSSREVPIPAPTSRAKIERRKLDAKPMSIEDALMHLVSSEDIFLAFTNDKTLEMNVVYKKNSGNYTLIEP
ncbi:TPA: ribosome-associated translation inhibitor RaiA [bacterium]|nr:ribosome-associated translation inhibitor RaiA [bacterium]